MILVYFLFLHIRAHSTVDMFTGAHKKKKPSATRSTSSRRIKKDLFHCFPSGKRKTEQLFLRNKHLSKKKEAPIMYHTQNSSSSKRAWEEAAHLISSSTTEKNPSVLKTWRNPGQFYNVSPPAISSNRSWMKEESREVIDLDLYYT